MSNYNLQPPSFKLILISIKTSNYTINLADTVVAIGNETIKIKRRLHHGSQEVTIGLIREGQV